MTGFKVTSTLNSMNEFNRDILSTTMVIHETCPELSKYLDEMPVTIPDTTNPIIGNQQLMDYSESLRFLLNKYKLLQQ